MSDLKEIKLRFPNKFRAKEKLETLLSILKQRADIENTQIADPTQDFGVLVEISYRYKNGEKPFTDRELNNIIDHGTVK